ncbi:MAG: hypothetical protein ACE5E2_04070 [Candidatus Binatia bacterium]
MGLDDGADPSPLTCVFSAGLDLTSVQIQQNRDAGSHIRPWLTGISFSLEKGIGYVDRETVEEVGRC